MDALAEAKRLLERAEAYYNASEEKGGNAFYRGKRDEAMQHAAIFAAVAQAEQLKRIGDMVEGYLATYCDPAVFGQDSDELAEARTDYADVLN